jgi:RNA polymerase-binding transcription factor DksA
MAKKPAPKKKAPVKQSKPTPKKVAKPAAKKVVKAAKPAAKKPVAKKVASKPAVKKAVKPIAKAKVIKPAAKKAVVKKTAPKPVAKKIAPKPVAKKAVKPAAKPIKKVEPVKVENTKAVVSKKETKKMTKVSKAKAEKPSKRPVDNTPIPELKLPIFRKVGPQPLKRSTVDLTRTRYSDKELEEFKDLINEKMGKSKEELHYIQEQITKSSENSTSDTENRFGGMEDGAGTLEREYLNQMASRLGTFIGHLEKALMRIDNKTYGICRVTGSLISKERLRAVPHATLSLEAKEKERR